MRSAHLSDGIGEAADDLLPDSPFLKALNARPRRAEVAYHILAGDSGFITPETRKRIETQARSLQKASGLLGNLTSLALGDLPSQLDEITDGTGDGCVSVASTRLEGVTDRKVLHANHVELIRGPLLFPEPGPVVCMPYVLEWLKAPDAE